MKHVYRGSCHCGALAVVFRTDQAQLALRACQCSFCQRHQARYASDPDGHIRFVVRDPDCLQRYQFGARTLDFLLCRNCGCYLGATLDGQQACVNVNSWQHVGEATPADYDGESVESRTQRRKRGWSPSDMVVCRQGQAEALLDAYFAELAQLLGGFDPSRGPTADPGEMAPPLGAFLVMSEHGQALACGGVKTHQAGVGEIKRMYVDPAARRRGLSRDLLWELERAALELGMKRLLLDTAEPLQSAQALYLSGGYQEVADYNGNPYAAHWFAKSIE